jgi:hypothetical protein
VVVLNSLRLLLTHRQRPVSPGAAPAPSSADLSSPHPHPETP